MLIALLAAVVIVSPETGAQRAVDLSWMEGHWLSCDEAGEQVAETWIAAGETLLGASVTHRGETVAAWEQMRIVHTPTSTQFVAMPNGVPVRFDLQDQMPEGAVFQNASHDWPNVIVYERDGDILTATVRGLVGEAEPEMSWRFTAAPFGARCP